MFTTGPETVTVDVREDDADTVVAVDETIGLVTTVVVVLVIVSVCVAVTGGSCVVVETVVIVLVTTLVDTTVLGCTTVVVTGDPDGKPLLATSPAPVLSRQLPPLQPRAFPCTLTMGEVWKPARFSPMF